MSNLSDIRPKLRQDSVFLQLENGAFLRNSKITFTLKGKSIYRWISLLSPFMTGEHTLAELCDGLEPGQRDMVVRLVTSLIEKNVIKNVVPEEPDLLPDRVRQHFHSLIEFIDHYVDNPLQSFKTFRESRVLLIGSGEVYTALTISLLRNGLKEIHLAPADGPERYIRDTEQEIHILHEKDIEACISVVKSEQDALENLGNYDIVAYCSDTGTLKEVFELQQRCIHKDQAFFPAVMLAGKALLGPYVRTRNGPCWLCALLRFTANADSNLSSALWKEISVGGHFLNQRTSLTSPLARRIGNGLGFELFKILVGHLPSDVEGGVVVQDLETLESPHGPLVQHPLCPLCSSFDSEMGVQRLLEITAGERDREQTTEEFYHKCHPLVDARVGAFKEFTHDTISQTPLKTSRIIVNSPASPASENVHVMAYAIENLWEARNAVLHEAVRRYVRQLPDERGMVFASLTELSGSGKRAIAADELSTWSGLSLEPNAQYAWLPAFSLAKQSLSYVPTAAIYPSTHFNNQGIFEKTSAGSATGQTFRETLTRGILSALSYEYLRKAVQQQNSIVTLQTEVLEESDPDLAFLLASIKHLQRTVTILEIVDETPVHVILACTDVTSTDYVLTIGTGLSGREAANKALLDLTGRLQSLHFEGKLPDYTDEPLPGFSLRSNFIHADSQRSRFQNQATTIEQLENYLWENERDVLFVNTASTDIWKTGALISGTVLLTRAKKRP